MTLNHEQLFRLSFGPICFWWNLSTFL